MGIYRGTGRQFRKSNKYEFEVGRIDNSLLYLWTSDGYELSEDEKKLIISEEKEILIEAEALFRRLINYILERGIVTGIKRRERVKQFTRDFGIKPRKKFPTRLPTITRGKDRRPGTLYDLLDRNYFTWIANMIKNNPGLSRRKYAAILKKRYMPFKIRALREGEAFIALLEYFGFLRCEGIHCYYQDTIPLKVLIKKEIDVTTICYDVHVIGEYYIDPHKKKDRIIKIKLRVRKCFRLGVEPPKLMSWVDVFQEIKQVFESDEFIDEVCSASDDIQKWSSGEENFKLWFDPGTSFEEADLTPNKFTIIDLQNKVRK